MCLSACPVGAQLGDGRGVQREVQRGSGQHAGTPRAGAEESQEGNWQGWPRSGEW